MNEYEIFKKWVNSFDEKIYYKTKPPTKKELYEIAIKQEEEIERLNNKLLKIKELINRTPRQTPKEIAYIMLKSEIAKVIGVDKE